MRNRAPYALVVLLAAAPAPAQETTVRLAITADNSIIDVGPERGFNMGAATGLRLKSFQHHLVLRFDTAPLQGRTVTSARLRYARRDHVLQRVTVSTIQADWGEGQSGGFAESVGGSTYLSARHGATPEAATPWAWPGSSFPDVVYGNSYSLMSESGCDDVDGYYDWEVAPDLVHANAVGAAYGLAVFEADSDVSRNPTVWSREQADHAPSLLVVLGPAVEAPGAIPDLTADERRAARGELVLSFTAPERAFSYDVTIDGVPAPRYMIPFAEPGTTQRIRIRDVLAPGQAVQVEVIPVSRSGERGQAAAILATPSDRTAVPFADLQPAAAPAGGGDKVVSDHGDVLVWAVPETDRVRPDGSFVDEVPAGYAGANPVFSDGRIRLHAARNEVVAFVLALEAASDPVRGIALFIGGDVGAQVRA